MTVPLPESRPEATHGVQRVLSAITRSGHAWGGAGAMLSAGSCWAVLCALLARDGHMPSRTLVPIARETYYAAQASFVIPLLILLWLLCSLLTTAAARALGGRGRFVATANGLGFALGLPLLVLFLLPDLVVYATHGFAALRFLLRVTAPLSFLTTLWLATVAVRASQQLGRGRAFLAAAAGVLAQAALGGILLR